VAEGKRRRLSGMRPVRDPEIAPTISLRGYGKEYYRGAYRYHAYRVLDVLRFSGLHQIAELRELRVSFVHNKRVGPLLLAFFPE
jgi:hypothetical protein